MDPTLTNTDAKEQRLLAAIVFTDVVGFSRLAAKNEARVYVSLQRDMGVMTDLCRAHGGQVLNTMGDGMLMCFPSAVDAMAAAVEIQRTLAAQAKSLPATDVLNHRIGVHLGDVIMKEGNVFGDGVNTAARLQNDARPGSIWYSQTVNEVIKNKLKLDSRYVGKRQFKNLGDPVQVWEIPPISEIAAKLEADAAGLNPTLVTPEANDGVAGGKAFLLVLVSLLMIGSVVFLVMTTKVEPEKKAEHTGKPRPDKPPQASATTTGATTGATTGTTTAPAITETDVLRRIEELKRTYSFGEIVTFLTANGAAMASSSELITRYGKLEQLKQWMDSAILQSQASDMIFVQLSTGSAQIYTQGQNAVIQIDNGDLQPFALTQLIPADFHALGVVLQTRQSAPAPPEAGEWLSLFATEYQLS